MLFGIMLQTFAPYTAGVPSLYFVVLLLEKDRAHIRPSWELSVVFMLSFIFGTIFSIILEM